MKPKEMHKLKKSDLIQIVLRQEEEIEFLTLENQQLQEQITSPDISFETPGTLVDAASEILAIFQKAQKQADQFDRIQKR